jgi:5'-nucleotidase
MPASASAEFAHSRRRFLKTGLGAMALAGLGQWPLEACAETEEGQRLCVLHTNDVHSRLDPFPMDGSANQGLGGIVAREKLIRYIREKEEQVLLLDAGDIFQGTPYFNFYRGKPEMQAMSLLRYDAATIGNHDFDAGVEGLATQMVHADFDFVNCNYRFNGTPLEYRMKPWTILRRGKLRIGILGVGVALKGLVPDTLCEGIGYEDPVRCVNETAYHLRVRKKCDYVICLSHLGFSYPDDRISDLKLAAQTEHVHCIIGGHTHTLLQQPYKVKNLKSQEVIINQVGWAGLHLGRIDIFFNHKKHPDYIPDLGALSVGETRV